MLLEEGVNVACLLLRKPKFSHWLDIAFLSWYETSTELTLIYLDEKSEL